MTTQEPTAFSALVAEHLATLSPASPVRAVLKAAVEGHQRCQRRRAAVLKREDLRKRLEQRPLSFPRASQWNGYVPPATVNPGEPEVLRQVRRMQDNTIRYWLNPKNRRTQGEIPNDSGQRAVLIAISAVAWQRERADDAADMQPPGSDLPDPLPEEDQPSARPAGTASSPGLHDPAGQLNGHNKRVEP